MIGVYCDNDWWSNNDDGVWWFNHDEDDRLIDDRNGAWWLNLFVMIDELRIIMRCSVIWISKIYILNMISKYCFVYVYDDACLCFNC